MLPLVMTPPFVIDEFRRTFQAAGRNPIAIKKSIAASPVPTAAAMPTAAFNFRGKVESIAKALIN
jgi:hypothetical protein